MIPDINAEITAISTYMGDRAHYRLSRQSNNQLQCELLSQSNSPQTVLEQQQIAERVHHVLTQCQQQSSTTSTSQGLPENARPLSGARSSEAVRAILFPMTTPDSPSPTQEPSSIYERLQPYMAMTITPQAVGPTGLLPDLVHIISEYEIDNFTNSEQIMRTLSTQPPHLVANILLRTIRDPESNSQLMADLLKRAGYSIEALMNLPSVNRCFTTEAKKQEFREAFIEAVRIVSIPDPDISFEAIRQLCVDCSNIQVITVRFLNEDIREGFEALATELYTTYPKLQYIGITRGEQYASYHQFLSGESEIVYGYRNSEPSSLPVIGRAMARSNEYIINPYRVMIPDHPNNTSFFLSTSDLLVQANFIVDNISNHPGLQSALTTDEQMDACIEGCRNGIHGIDLRGIAITDAQLERMCRDLPNLEHIILPAHATDETMRRLKAAAPNLQYINIEVSNRITSAGLAHFTSEAHIVRTFTQVARMAIMDSGLFNILGSMMP